MIIRRCAVTGLLSAAVLIILAAWVAVPARADFSDYGIASASASESTSQAGAHPDLTLAINFKTNSTGRPWARTKEIRIELPAGLVGDPNAYPKCSPATFANIVMNVFFTGENCPQDSQVGVVQVQDSLISETLPEPLYNLATPAGGDTIARLGFIGVFWPFEIDFKLRTGSDYGLTADVQAPGAANLISAVTTTWGVPSDPSHDGQRFTPEDALDCLGECNGPVASGLAPTAFLTNPSRCESQTVSFSAASFPNPDTFDTAAAPLPNVTGCGSVPFHPSISLQPTTSQADSPSGLSVELSLPQDDATNPGVLGTSDLKRAVVTLPQGVSLNPSAANGLEACSPAEIGLDNTSEPTCPDASKVGSVEIDTPLLPDPLLGGVYVADQGNNPFNSLLAIYVTAQGDGALVKLAGHVVTDPSTGQLTTTFDNNPQLPFSDLKLDFFGGPGGVLATPQQCGTYTTQSSLSPWSGTADATLSDSFQINSGCVSGFSPSFTAGVQSPQAGAFSPFVLSFSRSDTDQELSGLTVKLPPGMLAKLAGVQECTGAQLAQAAVKTGGQELAGPSCPSGSQVGTVETGAGVGPDPYYIAGKAYLTGPYKGAPYSLAVVVPAVAGPFDLGTVVVRQALFVDPTTAQVTDVSDPFPTILDGIPLRIRSVSVDLNRPKFTINPTSCDPMATTGTLTSTGGLTANVGSRFQVGGCQDIGFSPKLKLALSGKGKTRSGDHPTLTATLTDPAGQANIRSAKVALPLSIALDPDNSQHVCAFATAQAVHGGAVGCPASTVVGTATAVTPLLSKPLTGNVYLVQGLRCAKGSISAQGTCAGGNTAIHTLPTLLVPLRGQIALDLRAKSAVNGVGALVTTFPTIPDAPVSKFTLQITGGKKGLLVITGRGQTICRKPQIAGENLGAQSGKSMVADDTLTTPCAKSKGKAKEKTTRGRNTKKQ